ncbi:transcription factor DIVARICATA-like [Dendrobium catenatum]|uniref:Transcription factor MYBS1 n=1 Tax=Dendrobium catenatum TaxID=906689 RepID=A0A2I0VZR0_9ASPA|nr:transcription factor DIVARICATA-like [Dendrobium catenatum]XP_020694735.1 transcription factor DIVARICATA-like [Dendrobium catenatum]PKU68879.1 Transcription factor DIVARICATA [Dendrobium catenatum]
MMTNSGMEVLSPAPAYFSNSYWMRDEKKCGNWTQQENKLFEKALARFDRDTPERWLMVAKLIPGKTVDDVVSHYRDLEEDVSCIEAGLIPFPGYSSSSLTLDWENDQSFDGLKQDYYVGGKRSGCRLADHDRKKGVPWTEEEHKRFLLGLKKYGKGDWRNISRNFVVTRTPTQVASHAQKYFLRLNSGGKDKRRASIHDITTINMEDNSPPSPSHPSVATMQSCSAIATGTSEQFSVVVDSKQPNEVANFFSSSINSNQYVQSPYGIQAYGMIQQARNLHHSNLSGPIVGNNGGLF